jgi:hypothetical protein
MVLLLLCAIAPAALAAANDFIVADGRGNLVRRAGTEAVVRRIGNVAVIHYRDARGDQNTVTYVKVGGRWERVK